jgi:hypothetical protein
MYRKKSIIYTGLDTLQFRASTGDLGMFPHTRASLKKSLLLLKTQT